MLWDDECTCTYEYGVGDMKRVLFVRTCIEWEWSGRVFRRRMNSRDVEVEEGDLDKEER